MTETKRWSEVGSEVDPVLRSVMRYAQQQAPSSTQLQQLIQQARPRRLSSSRRPLRSFLIAVTSGVAAALGGLAWASYLGAPAVAPAPPLPSVDHGSSERQLAESPPRGNAALDDPALAPHEAATATPPVRPVASGFGPAATATIASSAHVDASRDLELLREARRVLATDSARALTVLRDHQVHFPRSPLQEERSALLVEALERLGRRSEATAELERLERLFPLSPYRRRLRALVSAP
jgi:hypothetical protein